MSTSIRFLPIAQFEYDEAAYWYDQQRPGQGDDFVTQVRKALDEIATQPDRYPVSVRGIRQAPVIRYPYAVCYRVRNGRIMVVAVFHQSRNPADWQSRS